MEKDNVQKQVADTIAERPIFLWFGMIPFMVRPLTFTQLFDIGSIIALRGGEITIEVALLNGIQAALRSPFRENPQGRLA